MNSDLQSRAKSRLAQVSRVLKVCVETVRSLYQVEVKVTIIVRVPGMKRGDVLFGDDDPAEVIETIRRVTSAQNPVT